MTTNRNESLDLGRALRRESEGISESPVMSESRDEIRGYEAEPDVRGDVYETETRGEEIGNHVREVNIKPLDSGYLVKVGCQSVAVETTETLLKALGDYLNNPDSFERAWYKNKNRNKL
jgi:hypothetical protein